jgi:hypothetical protein
MGGGEYKRARSASVSVPPGRHAARGRFSRSTSFKAPPEGISHSPNSFKVYWGEDVGDGNKRSFKESVPDAGDGRRSFGQTPVNLGTSCGSCTKSFKAPAGGASECQKSFKSPTDRGGGCGSFKAPRETYRCQASKEHLIHEQERELELEFELEQEPEEVEWHDMLHPLRAELGK